ncbi:MAG TPA: hypothetical protein VEL03_12650 [Streptosporangiaceae bacterium]|nr:hypothetical protein [Streptosporangiaceae bacterium]
MSPLTSAADLIGLILLAAAVTAATVLPAARRRLRRSALHLTDEHAVLTDQPAASAILSHEPARRATIPRRAAGAGSS